MLWKNYPYPILMLHLNSFNPTMKKTKETIKQQLMILLLKKSAEKLQSLRT